METGDEPLCRTCYRSLPIREPMTVILDIIREAERKNSLLDICGMLYFSPFSYLQMLEGPLASVHGLMDRIRTDPRHRVSWETQAPVARRSFQTALPMGFIADYDLENGQVEDRLYLRRNDFSDIEIDDAVGFLVAAGHCKYPSMAI